tara:strand:+ start:3237 stop:4805 length:1569 start_codon:yes stop_codon:yes gene_type:complete
MYNLAIYSGHNCSFTVSKGDQILEILELERYTNVKNAGLLWYFFTHNPLNCTRQILNYFKEKYGAENYENLICNHDDVNTWSSHLGKKDNILSFFNCKNIIEVYHQFGHASGAFYQSDLQEAKIISFDGGGNDGCFNFYNATREKGVELDWMDYDYNIGEKYAEIGRYTPSIRQDPWSFAYLVYAGKLMGLSGYGSIRKEWIPSLRKYYKGHDNFKFSKLRNYAQLKKDLNLPKCLEGDLELDMSRTSQKIFEDIFYEVSKDYIDASKGNLILSGGCALNILNNTAVNNITRTFIPPNPNDSGLSLGFMLSYLKPKTAFDATYMGPEVWDKNSLHEYVHKHKSDYITPEKIIDDLLIPGKIIGVVRGRSEIGPRALGNRSILCNPSIPNMKDILNKKVKNREYYRPFAPVVRLKDVNKFFEFNQESRWMSFCPKVKEEYKSKLEAITHIDGTARVQTVTQKQNPWLYELLTWMDQRTGIGVLLNTSFNIAGKPILNTYRDAIWMLENTEMDGLILENYHIQK